MELKPLTTVEAFAFIVDINAFTPMVLKSEGNLIAQYVRDVLAGGIDAVETNGGEVVAFMGDAFLAVLPTSDSVVRTCFLVAKDLDQQCEWISEIQKKDPFAWPYSPSGPSLKIGVEYGWIDISDTETRFLGKQPLLIGHTINYATRILSAGVGNRCHFGPKATKLISSLGYSITGPYQIGGKKGELPYKYWVFDMGEIWREGVRKPNKDSCWG